MKEPALRRVHFTQTLGSHVSFDEEIGIYGEGGVFEVVYYDDQESGVLCIPTAALVPLGKALVELGEAEATA